MLNTCLTVRAHEAASHKNKGWERFTQKVLEIVAKTRNKGVVFLAWGSPAQQRCKGLGTSGKHLVLQTVHPSPLSAHKGFMTCGHFKKTNEWLESRYGHEGTINWNLDEPKPIAAPEAGITVKVTADQKVGDDSQGPATKVPEKQTDAKAVNNGAEAENEDEFEEGDADAIEALEEIAQADAEAEEKERNEKERKDKVEAEEEGQAG
jgi:hypothetical protein